MDTGTLGAISTVLVMLAFSGVCWWAFSPRRKKRFEDDARLPFADEQQHKPADDEASEESDGRN